MGVVERGEERVEGRGGDGEMRNVVPEVALNVKGGEEGDVGGEPGLGGDGEGEEGLDVGEGGGEGGCGGDEGLGGGEGEGGGDGGEGEDV